MTQEFVDIFYILEELGLKASLGLLGSRLFSVNHYFVLRKNLMDEQHAGRSVNKQLELTPITDADIDDIIHSLGACSAAEKRDVLSYLLFYQNGFKNCYVIRREGKIAYMQTLIYPCENELINRSYRSKFYPLKETQVMIENVFTFPAFRGLGCFQTGTGQLLDIARSKGYRSALCYVRKDRVAALTELVNMGFRITKMMPEYKVLGRVWREL